VRAPVPLGAHEGPTASAPKEPPSPRAPSPPHTSLSGSSAQPPKAGAQVAAEVPAAPRAAEPTSLVASPREAIAAAVRACATGRGRPGDVRVTVSSALTLQVGEGGVVASAVFAPPLQPEIQTCAAAAIYKVKVGEPGPVTIPIEFSY
jgi:hypothetical protein